MQEGRNLTDADVKAIADKLRADLIRDFKLDVGGGVIALAKKAFVVLLLLLAIYGMANSAGISMVHQ